MLYTQMKSANAEPIGRILKIFSARSSTGETVFGSVVEPVNPSDKAILGKKPEEFGELGQLERFNQKEHRSSKSVPPVIMSQMAQSSDLVF